VPLTTSEDFPVTDAVRAAVSDDRGGSAGGNAETSAADFALTLLAAVTGVIVAMMIILPRSTLRRHPMRSVTFVTSPVCEVS
jgi:hypothetical protein